jgi:hypothetical protein
MSVSFLPEKPIRQQASSRSGGSRIVGANRLATLAGYAAGMDTDTDAGKNDAFLGLVLLMRIFWGPMFWPIIIGNALAYLWCVYQVLT